MKTNFSALMSPQGRNHLTQHNALNRKLEREKNSLADTKEDIKGKVDQAKQLGGELEDLKNAKSEKLEEVEALYREIEIIQGSMEEVAYKHGKVSKQIAMARSEEREIHRQINTTQGGN